MENVVPCSARRFLVLTRGVMASRNTSWSSVNTMTMLGRVVEHLVRERMHNKGRKEIMVVVVHIHKSIGVYTSKYTLLYSTDNDTVYGSVHYSTA